MKKVVIERLKAENCALFHEFEIMANGDNVIITGQNGAGKSTVRKMIEWCLLGSTLDGEKLIPCDGSGLPNVEIRLFEGEICTKIAKEVSETRKNGRKTRTSNCFLNGMPATQKDIAGYFRQYADKEVVPYLLNPFKFLEVNVEFRRAILTGLFAEITDAEVINTDESLKELELGIQSGVKDKMRRLKKEISDIPARIDTLRSQLKEVTVDETLQAQINELEREKAAISDQLASWKEKAAELQKVQEKISSVTALISQKEVDVANLKSIIIPNDRLLNEMRQKLKQLQTNTTCPTCGQRIPAEKVEAAVDRQIVEGKKLRAETDNLKNQLAEVEAKIKKLESQKAELVKPAGAEFGALAELSSRKDAIQREILLLRYRKATSEYQIKLNAENERKIAELAAREQEVGKELSWCEKQIALFEKFVTKRAEMITDGINAHFEKVRWQMFETTKSGEIKNICTATLDGVPYELLSKGEKFRAALDVLKAFQTFYGVEFPLIIDDAESYTSNSYGEVENQLILLKVVEGQGLKIKVGDKE